MHKIKKNQETETLCKMYEPKIKKLKRKETTKSKTRKKRDENTASKENP